MLSNKCEHEWLIMTKELEVNYNSKGSFMTRGTRESSQELIEVRSGHRGHLGVSPVDLGFEPELVQKNLSGINVNLREK